MNPLESAYWWGARDTAVFELNELTALRAPASVRQHALEILLSVAEMGNAQFRSEIGKLTSPSQKRPRARPPGAVTGPRRGVVRSSRGWPHE